MKRLETLPVILLSLYLLGGCASRSPILMERKVRGRIIREEKSKKDTLGLQLEPEELSQKKEGVEIVVRFTSRDILNEFFKDRVIEGIKVGENPFPLNSIVFYILINNTNTSKIRLIADNFVLLDDLKNQYSSISPEYMAALYSSRVSLYTVSKTAGDAAPGIYGAPAKTLTHLTSGPLQKRLSVLKQVSLNRGYIYGGVSYEGYVAFPRSRKDATRLKLIIPEVAVAFTPNGEVSELVEFIFEFTLKYR